jgi:hypothetical protein
MADLTCIRAGHGDDQRADQEHQGGGGAVEAARVEACTQT